MVFRKCYICRNSKCVVAAESICALNGFTAIDLHADYRSVNMSFQNDEINRNDGLAIDKTARRENGLNEPFKPHVQGSIKWPNSLSKQFHVAINQYSSRSWVVCSLHFHQTAQPYWTQAAISLSVNCKVKMQAHLLTIECGRWPDQLRRYMVVAYTFIISHDQQWNNMTRHRNSAPMNPKISIPQSLPIAVVWTTERGNTKLTFIQKCPYKHPKLAVKWYFWATV